MGWFADNIEGSLQHWFGSLMVVYDGDPAPAALAAPAGAALQLAEQAVRGAEREPAAAASQDEQQQQQLKEPQEQQQAGHQEKQGQLHLADSAESVQNSTVGDAADGERCCCPTGASTTSLQQLDEQDGQGGPQRYMFGFQPRKLAAAARALSTGC